MPKYQSKKGKVNRRFEVTSDDRTPIRTRGQTIGFGLYHLTKTALSWLIKTNTIQDDSIVLYMDPKYNRVVLEGTVKSHGILCHCCSTILTVMDFQNHAGYNNPRPYAHIFVEPGVSLLNCMVKSWEKTQTSSTHLVDACVKFSKKGDFICCSKCGFKYDLRSGKMDVPEISWLCPYCTCKSCGMECVVVDNDPLASCWQCEKCHHWKCYLKKTGIFIKDSWKEFCDLTCKQVYIELDDKVGAKNEIEEGFSWTLLPQLNQELASPADYEDVVWHSKLAIARSVMEECFLSPTYGLTDHVNFNYQTRFNGSYTAILEKDDEMISMACIRIHGRKLAEIPFIGTCENYRHEGMCRRLMIGIESVLCHLQIKYLVITSPKEMVPTWIKRYGFKKIESSLEQEIRLMKTMTFFYNATKLQKTLTVDSGASGSGLESESALSVSENDPVPKGFR